MSGGARDLAEQFGIHRTTLTAHLEREGVAIRRGQGLRADQVDELVRLYREGWSARKLAKRFRVSDHTIAAELRKAGVEVRSRSRSDRPRPEHRSYPPDLRV
jgi:lambda repressor-like predicted transcriptional regulator